MDYSSRGLSSLEENFDDIKMHTMPFSDYDTLKNAGVRVTRAVRRIVSEENERDPADTFLPIKIGVRDEAAKAIDLFAEFVFRREIIKVFQQEGHDITVLGEEKLKNEDLDLSAEPGIFALADIVDGTDLLERGLSNWCSAVVFFEPAAEPDNRILGSFVALPDDNVYYALHSETGAFVAGVNSTRESRGPSSVTRLQEASLYFYGQKVSRLVDLMASEIFGNLQSAVNDDPRTRIYNLAGNPIAARLIDDRAPLVAGIDAIFEAKGQRAHDCVPGLYIALKGGARLSDWGGQSISVGDLSESLLRPHRSRLAYVLASTEELRNSLSSLRTEGTCAL